MKPQVRRHCLMVALLAGMIALLIGCSKPVDQSFENLIETPKSTPLVTLTMIPTISNPIWTFTPSSTSSLPTRKPTGTVPSWPTRTPLPSPTITWTPIATLRADEALNILLGYYEDNGGCELPCWWGIIPGQTSWQEARAKLSPLGQEYGPFIQKGIPRYDYSWPVPEEIAVTPNFPYFESGLWVKNGLVSVISLNSHFIQRDFDYSLANLLKIFGVPEEIWVKIVTDTQYEPLYEIDLFYPAKGLLLNATGNAKINESTISICPQEFQRGNFPPAIMLFSPSEGYSFELLGEITGQIDVENYHLLRDLTDNYNENDFYNVYIDQTSSTCIDVDLTKIP